MPNRRRASLGASDAGDLGFERQLFRAADKLRSNMDAAEYKHVVLGLVFLKYVSDAFAEVHARRVAAGRDAEDRAAYAAEGVFWVPRAARWAGLASAGPDGLGRRIDAAMRAIERDNPPLAGVLVRDEGWLARTGQRLGELVELIGTIGLGSAQRSKDILGRVYEYFLSEFAVAEGRKGGQFYTPRSVVRLLVELLTPYDGRVYDPCCGSGGMFVQSERSVAEHGGRALKSMHIYGQESNPTTWRLARMNLALRGISADLGAGPADTLQHDMHPGLAVEYILANPPFNARDWGAERLVGDPRWRFGVPPASNANFAWVQHIIHHMGRAGQAGFVLANGSMSSNISGEGAIRGRIVEADLVDAMVALPGQLFYSTQIPACVWLLARDRGNRRGRVLFIDARQLGRRIDRSQCELTNEVIARIAGVYHAWRGGESPTVPGFCASASVAEIRANNYLLTPGRYVGSEARAGERSKDRLAELAVQLDAHVAAGAALDAKIRQTLAGVLRG